MLSELSRFQLIKMSNVYKNELRLNRSPSYWENLNANQEKFLLRKGNVILTLTGTVNKRDYGYSVIIPENNKFLLNQRLVSLQNKESISESGFIRQLVLTSHFYYYFFSNSKGGTGNQSNVSIDDLKNIKLNIPSLPEQQKIAFFLSVVDKKIQLLTRKKELLEKYKKGVMQKLFSQEVRFKDENGKDYPDWEEKRLGELAIINPKSKTLPDTFIYIDLESVAKGRLLKEEEIELENAPSRAQRLLKKGDILFQTVRPYQKNNYFFEKDGDYVASTGYAQMRAKGNALFLYQLLHYQPLVNLIIRWSTGSNYPAINPSDLRKIHTYIPSITEQNKISGFLSNIDNKIEALIIQITQTQNFKKGLLQQMFV